MTPKVFPEDFIAHQSRKLELTENTFSEIIFQVHTNSLPISFNKETRFKMLWTPICDRYMSIRRDIHYQCGFRVAPPAHPPTAQNVLNFMQFFTNFGKIICWHPLEGWRPLLRGIPDSPLITNVKFNFFLHKLTQLDSQPNLK